MANSNTSSLADTVNAAKKQIRKMKKAAPYIYGEHQELQWALANYKAACERLCKAQDAWSRLGN